LAIHVVSLIQKIQKKKVEKKVEKILEKRKFLEASWGI
jgi:hypothetical protein